MDAFVKHDGENLNIPACKGCIDLGKVQALMLSNSFHASSLVCFAATIGVQNRFAHNLVTLEIKDLKHSVTLALVTFCNFS